MKYLKKFTETFLSLKPDRTYEFTPIITDIITNYDYYIGTRTNNSNGDVIFDFKYKNHSINLNCNYSIFFKFDGEEINISKTVLKKLFSKLIDINYQTRGLLIKLGEILTKNNIKFRFDDYNGDTNLMDRLEEFDVIINGKIDSLNLQKLLEFYGIDIESNDLNSEFVLNENFITDFFKSDNKKVQEIIEVLSKYDYLICTKTRDFKKSNMGSSSIQEYRFKYLEHSGYVKVTYYYPVKSHFSKVNSDGSASKPKEFEVKIDNKDLDISSKYVDKLTYVLNGLAYQTECLAARINKDTDIGLDIIKERLDEFDVINNNGDVDLTSLNHLYDFYDKTYNPQKIEKIIKQNSFLLVQESINNSDDKVEEIINELEQYEVLEITTTSKSILSIKYNIYEFKLNNDDIRFQIKTEYINYSPVYQYQIMVNNKTISTARQDEYSTKEYYKKFNTLWSCLSQIVENRNIVCMLISNDISRRLIINNPNTRIRTGMEANTELKLMERLEEFGVFETGKIDYISLRSLYDFYEVIYDEQYIQTKIETKLQE